MNSSLSVELSETTTSDRTEIDAFPTQITTSNLGQSFVPLLQTLYSEGSPMSETLLCPNTFWGVSSTAFPSSQEDLSEWSSDISAPPILPWVDNFHDNEHTQGNQRTNFFNSFAFIEPTSRQGSDPDAITQYSLSEPAIPSGERQTIRTSSNRLVERPTVSLDDSLPTTTLHRPRRRINRLAPAANNKVGRKGAIRCVRCRGWKQKVLSELTCVNISVYSNL